MLQRYSSLLLIIILLAGCAGIERYKDDVKVTLVNIEVLESTLLEQRYLITLRVQNRTPQPLSVVGMSFDIDLNDKTFGSGVSNQGVTVEPFDDSLFELKMSSTIFGIIRQIQSFQRDQQKPFAYRISGRISALGSLISIPFDESGEIDLMPAADLDRTNSMVK